MHANTPIVDRQFIRHPSNVPLGYFVTEMPELCNMDIVYNVNQGGLSFHANEYISPNKWLQLYIPINENLFYAYAQVRWCKKLPFNSLNYSHFRVGVSFCSSDDAFSARMVEQVCHIEEYKKRVAKYEGRILDNDQAATEWITQYADSFPSFTH
ncbi:MAG: hypothetical protein ACI8VC_000076 [Candidatus Endobugula sp.]|jgi:hypothetical protein